MHRTFRQARPGFTLIELLVVIAIIGILASLLLGGVMMFLRKGPETLTKNDISQLAISLQRFQTDYKYYPPSKIILKSSRSQYGTTPLEQQSLQALNAMYPDLGNFTNIAWGGATPLPAGGVLLEGDQCLVFFLGGPPVGGGAMGLQGFSTDPRNPVNPNTDRKKYFDFDNSRLALRDPNSPFPSYLDHYKKMPYVYFSSGRRPEGYDINHAITGLGVGPYYQAVGKYYNPTTFQLISAGLDGQFGPGGLWTPAAAPNIGGGGKDDMSNFYDRFLGIAN